jgi:hypothetical protein
MNPTPKKRLVADWGLPTADDLPVMAEFSDGSVGKLTAPAGYYGEPVAWWPLVVPTEVEPPPERAPDGWRPMSELPDGCHDHVWIARENGDVDRRCHTARCYDAVEGRLWWRPIEKPQHPGVGR